MHSLATATSRLYYPLEPRPGGSELRARCGDADEMGRIYRNVAVSVLESHSRPSVTPWPVAAEQVCTWCGLPAAFWSGFGFGFGFGFG